MLASEEDKLNKNGSYETENVDLLYLSEVPICFEPITSLTNVFFDRDNQQIFCVRSNGVGGVIVKGPKSDLNMTFRMEDKGNLATIKFSPNLSILAIRRKDKCVIDFLNFKNSQPVYPEYSQNFKAKSSKFQECYWLDNNEILLVSEQGFEHYQIFPEKKALKLIKYVNMPLNWLIWSREIQVFIVSTGSFGSVLNPFVYSKGSFIKLPKFEVDLPLNLSKYRFSVDSSSQNINSQPNKYYLNESDVVIGRIYNEFYVMIIRQIISSQLAEKDYNIRKQTALDQHQSRPLNSGYSEIAMFKLLTDSPAKKTNILKINLSGRFTLNIIDELIVVHHRASYSSLIFDIKLQGEFDGYVTCNFPIFKKASIQPCEIPLTQLSFLSGDSGINTSNSNLIQMLANSNINSNQISSMSSASSPTNSTSSVNEMYSLNWLMFLPNIIIDAKLGCFWHINLNLKTNGDLKPFYELENDYLKLIEFLLNRKNTKLHLLSTCELVIKNHSSLQLIEKIFEKINELYKYFLLLSSSTYSNSNIVNSACNTNANSNYGNSNFYMISPTNNVSLANSSNSNLNVLGNEKNELPIICQYDMHNLILYPLLEDDKWWNSNSKYTIAIIIEYFRSLNCQYIPIEHFLYKLLVNALIKANKLYQLHQYLQYHVLSDSKPLACLLLSIQSTYPASNQLALDMLKRLGTANEEICDVLLSKGLILSALRFGIQMGLGDELNAAKFLETAKELNDPLIYHEVYKYFEDRNIRLRGNPAFPTSENCENYVKYFFILFPNKTKQRK